MEIKNEIEIGDLLDYLNEENIIYDFHGNRSEKVQGFSSLLNYKMGTLTWLKNLDFAHDLNILNDITVAVVEAGIEIDTKNVIEIKNSKNCFFNLIEHFFSKPATLPEVGCATYIAPSVKIGENVKIGHNCVLDGDITIGDGSIIYHNTTIINNVTIGRECVIQSGVVIGQDGFGYSEIEEHQKKMVKHYGGVIIEDNVLISECCCIARGTIDNTIIGAGSKIDSLCRIGHNVVIGKNVAVIAGTILYGSVQIGDNAYLASCVIRNQNKIGDNAFVGIGSVVVKDIDAGAIVAGNPAKPLKKK